MAQFLITIYRPTDFDPSTSVTPSMIQAIDALNEEMVKAGVRVFVGGLQALPSAHLIEYQAGEMAARQRGSVQSETDFIDGLWIIDVLDLSSALVWGEKAAHACQASVEVRQFYK